MFSYLNAKETKQYDSIVAARAIREPSEYERLVLSLRNHNWSWPSDEHADVVKFYSEREKQLMKLVELYGCEKLRALINRDSSIDRLLLTPNEHFFDEWMWVDGWQYRNSIPNTRVGWALNQVSDETYESVVTCVAELVSIGRRLGVATRRFIYAGGKNPPEVALLRDIAISQRNTWPGPLSAEAFFGYTVQDSLLQELARVDTSGIHDLMGIMGVNALELETGKIYRSFVPIQARADGPATEYESFTVQFTADFSDRYHFFTGR